MTYCHRALGSRVRFNDVDEPTVLATVKPLILDQLPAIVREGAPYNRVEASEVEEAATLEALFNAFWIQLLRDETGAPAAFYHSIQGWIDHEPLLEAVWPFLSAGSWYAESDDNSAEVIYFKETDDGPLCRARPVNEGALWVVRDSEFSGPYGRPVEYWYRGLFPEGPPFTENSPHAEVITILVRKVLKKKEEELLPCFPGITGE